MLVLCTVRVELVAEGAKPKTQPDSSDDDDDDDDDCIDQVKDRQQTQLPGGTDRKTIFTRQLHI